ncbi:TetR/AcrR family transcriptional regulator [Pseudomonas sp. TTU2014-080ASC]|uniref:TetR/AcrR family transcriptional regulator n=1 Tax=Pseudomonas sp. TTU2014-080ASC TaxID=1729724 RepID=UPI0007188113|nr:TetR/AcrR family transcriptional regulator [Pseudomonas sp. TTU2014-080ASC]KRW62771.1 TetR family transcriptional regulator [Pseudomonas sp. TTU2014-080ASC]
MAYRTTAVRIDRDQALRERIIACALERVAEDGFAALTMQALAEEVGIATGSLYRHFAGKGSLAATVFAVASQREVDALKSVIAASGDPSLRLRQGVERFAARAWNSRQLAFALIAEPVEPEVDEQRLRFREAYAGLFAQLLQEGLEQGAFCAQPVNLVSACLVGAIAEALVGPLSPQARAVREAGYPTPSLEEVSQALVTFCLRAVGAKEAQ